MGRVTPLAWAYAATTAAVLAALLVRWVHPPGMDTEAPGAGAARGQDRRGTGASAEVRETPAAFPRLPAASRQSGARVWSTAELALHNGNDPGRPLLLAILGEVYDVGPGARFYGPGGGYEGFAGRDGSRAFSGGEFDGTTLSSKVLDLKPESIQEIVDWRHFYREHAEYLFVGFLAERYFSEAGAATPEHARLEELHRAQDVVAKLEQELRGRFVGCNTRHVGAEPHFEIWCDDSYHGQGALPLHLYFELPAAGAWDAKPKRGGWCACLPPAKRQAAEAEAADLARRPQPGKATFRLVEYPECESGKQRCKRLKGSKPP